MMIGTPQLRPGSPPIKVTVYPSEYWDTESSTAQTVKAMVAGIHRSSADAWLCGMARAIPPKWNGAAMIPSTFLQSLDRSARERAAVAVSLWWFAKHFIKFVEDHRLLAKLNGLHDALELLTDPSVMAREFHPQGDCDCFTMFVCCLLECAGLNWDIVTLCCSRRQPGIWSHVFPRVHLSDTFALPMDASHGKYPGWSVPQRDIQRMQVWDRNGNPVSAERPQEEVI